MQRKTHRCTRQTLGLVLAVVALSCGGGTAPAQLPDGLKLASLSLAPAAISLATGATQALAATATFSDGATAQITAGSWSSSATSIAGVSAAGLVTAKAPGSATVKLTWEGKSASAAVTVTALAPTLVSLALTPDPIALSIGSAQALVATGTWSDGASAPILSGLTFTSSAPDKVTVSDAGVVTGVAAGDATVTAAGLGKSATAAAHVSTAALASVAVTPAPLKLTVGNTAQLTLTGSYGAGGTRDLTASATWLAADASVISVSSTGLVTALKIGNTTLTGTSTDGGITKSATSAVEVATAAGYDPSAGWNLVWADEFDGVAVDPANWTFDVGSGGWGNNESEYYRAENAVVAGGALTITAKVEAFGDAPYTSARMQTAQKQQFTYGKFTMRAKLPYSQAMWPAFWLLGANSNSFNLYGGNVTWPGCGEADIMEMIGGLADGSGDYTTHGTLHYYDASMRDPGPSYGYRYSQKLTDDFHLYELIWTPHSFTWTFDGVAFGTKVITADMEEFTKPMFILLNLAIGGAWGGWVDASTVFPQSYVIDYVRVYSNSTTAPGGAPGLATSWHLLNTAVSGATPAGETLDSAAGTVSGFQPTKMLTAPATWYSAPLTGKYDAGAWSVGVFTTSPGSASVLKAEVFKTAADGSGAISLGSAQVDTNTTGGGNHRSWFTLTGVTAQTFASQRMKLLLTPVSGTAAQMVYNGNDFDSLITTPWSAAP